MTLPRICLTLPEAAESVGLSERTLTRAHDRGDLIGHWSGTKRLYFPDDLHDYIASLPVLRPDRKAS